MLEVKVNCCHPPSFKGENKRIAADTRHILPLRFENVKPVGRQEEM